MALFLGLAAHLRGFEFTKLAEDLVLHPHGWFEIIEASPMRAELIELAALSNGSDWLIENHKEKLFRLSMTPLSVFFADELFSFVVAPGGLNGGSSKIPVRSEDNRSIPRSVTSVKNPNRSRFLWNWPID